MPLYEYACRSCGHRLEQIRRYDERLSPQPCPECGAATTLALSAPGMVGVGSRASSGFSSAPSAGDSCGPGCCGGACGV